MRLWCGYIEQLKDLYVLRDVDVRYEGACSNVINIARGGVKIPEKDHQHSHTHNT